MKSPLTLSYRTASPIRANRGYYGSVSHDVKATYVLYLGWFDGNPATLDELPPEEAAKKFVDYMGGADAILKKAKEDYDRGNYRWVARGEQSRLRRP